MAKKLMFVHYRTGERDGVSLEIEKRAQVARDLGAEVSYLTGYDGLGRPEAFVVPELDFSGPLSLFLYQNSFFEKLLEDDELMAIYYRREHQIYMKVKAVFESVQPDLLFVHNILAYGRNIPATTALIKVMDRFQIPTVAVNHDHWFERPVFLHTNYDFVRETLEILPPNRTYIIKHQVINSLSEDEVYRRRKIKPEKIGDYFNYSATPQKADDFNADLRSTLGIANDDIFLLHATRIVGRKAIENAIVYAHTLQEYLRAHGPLSVNGRTIPKTATVHLVFPNFAEVEAVGYQEKLQALATQLGVSVIWAADKFMSERKMIDGKKTYSFWDAYVYADLVTYTSTQEGFGNQFLEATFFRKPVVLFEYKVFLKDIKPEGYEYISLGSETHEKDGLAFVPETTVDAAVAESVKLLADPAEIKRITDKNFNLSQQHHDESVLVEDFKKLLT